MSENFFLLTKKLIFLFFQISTVFGKLQIEILANQKKNSNYLSDVNTVDKLEKQILD